MRNALSTRVLDSLINRLGGEEPAHRKEAREQLTAMGRPVVPWLVPLLEAPNEHVRWEAAKALGDIGGAAAAEALVECLADSDRDVRWVATEGLIASREEALEPVLHELIIRSGIVWVREAGIRVLDAVAQEETGRVLAPVLAALRGRASMFEVPLTAFEALTELQRSQFHLDKRNE